MDKIWQIEWARGGFYDPSSTKCCLSPADRTRQQGQKTQSNTVRMMRVCGWITQGNRLVDDLSEIHDREVRVADCGLHRLKVCEMMHRGRWTALAVLDQQIDYLRLPPWVESARGRLRLTPVVRGR